MHQPPEVHGRRVNILTRYKVHQSSKSHPLCKVRRVCLHANRHLAFELVRFITTVSVVIYVCTYTVKWQCENNLIDMHLVDLDVWKTRRINITLITNPELWYKRIDKWNMDSKPCEKLKRGFWLIGNTALGTKAAQ